MSAIQGTQTIKPGDTLSKIAGSHGISLQQLLDANRQISNPNLIQVGQIINIPDTSPVPDLHPAPGQPIVFDGIHPAKETISTNRENLITPPLTNDVNSRDRNAYDQLINQFAVGNNPRYLPISGETFCNIFMWDVTRAMGAEVPHWIDKLGKIVKPFTDLAHELNINGGIDWMKSHGIPEHGWRAASDREAQDNANQGKPSIITFKNPAGHGHTAVVRPGTITDKGPTIAQAGAHNFNLGHVKDSFGNHPTEYFIHD